MPQFIVRAIKVTRTAGSERFTSGRATTFFRRGEALTSDEKLKKETLVQLLREVCKLGEAIMQLGIRVRSGGVSHRVLPGTWDRRCGKVRLFLWVFWVIVLASRRLLL